ncbi:MAG TPA: DNA-primase RepB domain-containing protein [Actinomycetes bacterium]|jgi:hypothetical protein|nr:DNA-primase RepB domain-containing protein [Actinomycetes bacterium]
MVTTETAPSSLDIRREQERFFRNLFGSVASDYLYIARKRGDDFHEKYFEYRPTELDDALDYIAEYAQDFNLYYCAQLLSEKRRVKENVAKKVTAAWADLDECHPDKLLVKPSIALETSPGRYQTLWLFDEPQDADEVEQLSKRIAYFHRAVGADVSGWDLTQLLRVPGTPNHKYPNKPTVEVRTDLTGPLSRYRPSDFTAYPELPHDDSEHQDASELPDPAPLPDPLPTWLAGIEQADDGKFAKNPDAYDRHKLSQHAAYRAREHAFSDSQLRTFLETRHAPTMGRIAEKGPAWWPGELRRLFEEANRKHPHPEQTCEEANCNEAPKTASDAKDTSDNGTTPRLRGWTVRELLAEPDKFEWLAEAFCPIPSFLGIGGEEKTLKSYIGAFLDVSVAAGIAIFGEFKVQKARPVIRHIGEGGRIPDKRRLVRIARSMGISLAELQDLPILSYYQVVSESSKPFMETLRNDLEQSPGLVHIDPQYAYADRNVKSSDLVGRGGSLADLYAPVAEANAVLAINDHFNQTGSGFNLRRFTGAGMTEHVGSWCLVKHDTPPTEEDVANGHFDLVLKIGSRDWGELSWKLNLDIGPFDMTLNEHVGDITWEVSRTTTLKPVLASTILKLVNEHSGEFTKSALATAAGGKYEDALKTIEALEASQKIHAESQPFPNKNGQDVWRDRYVLGPAPKEGKERT